MVIENGLFPSMLFRVDVFYLSAVLMGNWGRIWLFSVSGVLLMFLYVTEDVFVLVNYFLSLVQLLLLL